MMSRPYRLHCDDVTGLALAYGVSEAMAHEFLRICQQRARLRYPLLFLAWSEFGPIRAYKSRERGCWIFDGQEVTRVHQVRRMTQ